MGVILDFKKVKKVNICPALLKSITAKSLEIRFRFHCQFFTELIFMSLIKVQYDNKWMKCASKNV
jgi:hypothetical protein